MSDERSGLTIDTRPETHWEECWREAAHHNCAIALIEYEQAVIDKLRRELAAARETVAAVTATLRPAVDDAEHAEAHYCGSTGA